MMYPKMLLIVVVVIACTGCSVRQVYRDSSGGVLALPVNANAWPFNYRDEAEQVMQRQFPQGYEITHEGEEVVGETTFYDEEVDSGIELFGGLISLGPRNVWGTETTSAETEYRIHYQGRQR